MKKLGLYVLFLIFPSILLAENLCDSWERKIEPDMQMEESLFNKENADLAKIALSKLNKDSSDLLTQFAIENHSRIIKGYTLKVKAKESELALQNYCNFFVNEAFYHD